MIDAEGRDHFLAVNPVSRETMTLLDAYVELLLTKNREQNLIARSTEAEIWTRHVLDSAQILARSQTNASQWLDVGSGAGLPGLVLAILTDARHVLVEPRRLRAEFLRDAVGMLELGNRVDVIQKNIEKLRHAAFDVITARAFSSLTNILQATRHLADRDTIWLLHKGRTATVEIEEARTTIDATYEGFESVTSPEAMIVRVSRMDMST